MSGRRQMGLFDVVLLLIVAIAFSPTVALFVWLFLYD